MNKCRHFLTATILVSLFTFCACTGGSGQTEPLVTPTPPTNSPARNETTAPPSVAPSATAQQPDDVSEPDTPATVSGEVIVSFDYEKQSGSASNQFAVWIEDMDGQLIKTLYVTRWTANGGYKTRPDSIAIWVEKSDIASMPDYYVDAISGATPKSSNLSYTWNLKDINGDSVLPGGYKFFVEGTLRWKNYVLYSGVITIGDAPVVVQADAEYVYEATDKQAALTENSPENNMIGVVTARFLPTP